MNLLKGSFRVFLNLGRRQGWSHLLFESEIIFMCCLIIIMNDITNNIEYFTPHL